MKIFYSVLFMFIVSAGLQSQAQNILSYGNNNVTRQEFVKAFLKNNTEQHPSEKSYRDYLELYIRFKLKVKAAYDLKMDTLPNQKAELGEFRRQIEAGFLNDDVSYKNLVQEAFVRSQKDIHLAHIFIPIDSAGSKTATQSNDEDTTGAWRLAIAAYHELEKGMDFSQVAFRYSADPFVKANMGDIGYITVFTLPYTLENLAYSIAPGKFSKPFRNKAGYHIFKNLGERKATGKIKVAQIVFAFPVDATNSDKAAAKQKADSVYNVLLHGAPFIQMADRFSSDINIQLTHGMIPEFGVGSFDSPFEEQIFALNKDGDITHPILTPAGYFIVKRISKTPVNENIKNDSALAVLKQQVQNDARMEVARNAMLQKIYQITSLKKSSVPENTLLTYAENAYNKKTNTSTGISDKTLLFSLPHQQIYLGDFVKYLLASRANQNMLTIRRSLARYQEIITREYYRNHLEEYNPEFAAQVKEFKEGNLLFEIMQRYVWDKASADSSGLRSFYSSNKNIYWWQTSADAIIFSCIDSVTAYDLRPKLETDIKNWKDVVPPYQAKVQVDSGRFELTQLPVNDQQVPKPGQLTKPLKKPTDNNTSFIYFIKLYPGKQPRDFEDAKGFVLNDYQTFLEDAWITSLKKKYPVKINEAVFRSLLK